MINIRVAVYVTSLACATAFLGCGDDDEDDGEDAAVDGGDARTAGSGGRAGTGGRGGRGGAGGSAGDDAGAEQDAGTDGDSNGNNNGDSNSHNSGHGPKASAAIMAFEDTPGLVGTADFVQTGSDVTIALVLMNCPEGSHAVHIHEGKSCETSSAPGAHWAVPRGVGIPPVTCMQNIGSVMYTRPSLPPNAAWSIGGDPQTDIVGHALVVHDQTGIPIACGLIMDAN